MYCDKTRKSTPSCLKLFYELHHDFHDVASLKLNIHFKSYISITLSFVTKFMGKEKQCKVRNIGIFILHIQKLYKEFSEDCNHETILFCHPGGLFVLQLQDLREGKFFGKHHVEVDVLGNNKPNPFVLLYFNPTKILNIIVRMPFFGIKSLLILYPNTCINNC